VIELKRTDYGGHMDLQAIRYAAMSFEQVVGAHEAYLTKRGLPDADEAAERVREFLELPPDEEIDISTEVRILLVAGDFSREITTASGLWLRHTCVQCRVRHKHRQNPPRASPSSRSAGASPRKP
jgi:hypothetical protein